MSDIPRTRPRDQPRRMLAAAAVTAAIFLGLHILPLFWRPNPFWATDFLSYMPFPVQGIFILLCALLFVPGFRRLVQGFARTIPFTLWERDGRRWAARALLLLVAVVAFAAFSSARHFLGDGYLLIRKLDAEAVQFQARAPLSFALIRTLHDSGRAFWETGQNTYRIYSYTSGALYILLTIPAAAAIGKNALQKSIVLAFLLTAGYMQHFFGYVENYALYMPGLLLYLLLGIQTLEGRMSIYAPAFLLGLLLALHQAFTVFGPSLLFLAYRVYRRQRKLAPSWKNQGSIAAALCCVPISAALLLWLSGIDLEAYLGRMGGRNFLPLFSEPGVQAQYRVFSLAHVFDFLNQQLLTAPAACMACALIRRKELRNQSFLVIATAVPLCVTFFASPEIGAFRDWDAFSLPALPFTLCAASIFLDRHRDAQNSFNVVFLVCSAAALHTALWIGVNARTTGAEARFMDHVDRLSGNAKVNGWITMGEFYRHQGKTDAALNAYGKSIEGDPLNPNRWLLVGATNREMGRSDAAIGYFKRARELRPGLAMPYMNLGAAYNDIRQLDKAIAYTAKAIELDPDLAVAQLNLSVFYRKIGRFDKSLEHLERACALRPKDGAIHGHLGMAYRSSGQNAKAIDHLEKAHALCPRHTVTLVNLAVVCSDEGKNDRALELLKKAATLQPERAAIHVNLGAVYGKTGQYKNAIQHLSRANELQPNNPQTYRNLGLIYMHQRRYLEAIEQLESALRLQTGQGDLEERLDVDNTNYDTRKHEEAIPHLQETIELDPGHANGHLLLGLAYRALKQGDQALAHFEKTLESEPNHPQSAQIRQWLGQIRE